MKQPSSFFLVLVTPIFIFFANYLTIYCHDFSHSLMAWLLGYKHNPFEINFGGWSFLNFFFLVNVGENVDYNAIYALGHPYEVALIAFAGPGIANVGLFFLSLYLLTKKSVRESYYLFYFIFWVNLMNLGSLYDYIPIRTFSAQGDVGHITTSLNISPWYIYIIAGYPVAFAIWHFFTRTMIKMFAHLKILSMELKAFIMSLCVFILFGYYGGAGLTVNDSLSHFLSITSMMSIPGIIAACWPRRIWVERQFQRYYHSSK